MITLAKRQPVGFAFNPGKSEKEHFLAMDKKKPGAMLGKIAKKEGPGSKVAFGTATVEGKLLQLRCESPLPAMANQLKKLLKLSKVSLNIEIMDGDGNTLEREADQDAQEELEESAEDGGDSSAAHAQDLPQGDPVAEDAAAAADEPDPAIVAARKSVSDGLKALQQQILALPKPVAAKFAKPFQTLVELLKQGDADRAMAGLKKLQAATQQAAAKVAARASEATPEKAPEAAKEATPKAAPVDKKTRTKVSKTLKALQRQMAALAPDAQGALRSHLLRAGKLIKAGDVDGATDALKAAHKALRAAQASAGIADPAKPLALWNSARDKVGQQIAGLQSALRNVQHPAFIRLADAGLNGITGQLQVGLQAALMDLKQSASPAARDKARAAVAEFRSFLGSDPVLPVIEANPLGVTVDVRGTLGAAMDDIDVALTA